MPKNLELDGPKESGKQTTPITSKQVGFLNENMTRGAQNGKHQKGQILIPRPKPKGEEKKLKHNESKPPCCSANFLKRLNNTYSDELCHST
jgi:hypothetical protein